ncbi:MAG: hypothetical protein ABI193_15375, partial [Minicystis sp.]
MQRLRFGEQPGLERQAEVDPEDEQALVGLFDPSIGVAVLNGEGDDLEQPQGSCTESAGEDAGIVTQAPKEPFCQGEGVDEDG